MGKPIHLTTTIRPWETPSAGHIIVIDPRHGGAGVGSPYYAVAGTPVELRRHGNREWRLSIDSVEKKVMIQDHYEIVFTPLHR